MSIIIMFVWKTISFFEERYYIIILVGLLISVFRKKRLNKIIFKLIKTALQACPSVESASKNELLNAFYQNQGLKEEHYSWHAFNYLNT